MSRRAQIPSQLCLRNTIATEAKANPTAPDLGFDFTLRISSASGVLPIVLAAFHLTAPIGLYLLLFDVPHDKTPGNGDPALITLGPTQGFGSTIVFSESESEAPIHVQSDGTIPEEYRGFPFDLGCYAATSSTPGVLTQAPAGWARITARWQRVEVEGTY